MSFILLLGCLNKMRRLVVFLYVRRQLSGERTSVRDPEGVLVEERTHLGRALLVQKDG